MSTPAGKVPHLVDLADHVARQARPARPAEPEQPVESGNDARPRSPYAPKPADERAAARLRVLAKDDTDDVVSVYAPKRARSGASGAVANSDTLASAPQVLKEPRTEKPAQDASGHAGNDAAPPLSAEAAPGISPDCANASEKTSDKTSDTTPENKARPVDRSSIASERTSGKPLLKPAPIGAPQPTAADDHERGEQRSDEVRRRLPTEREIERVEAILRQLQLQRRELGAMRLPHGPNLPPPSESMPAARDAGGSVLDRRARMLDTFGRPRSLEPTRMPPPPLQSTHNLWVIVGISTACVGAALAYYYLVSAPSSQPTLLPQMASLPPASLAAINTPQRPSQPGPRLDRQPDWAPRTSRAQSDDAQTENPPERGTSAHAMATSAHAMTTSQRPANAKMESAREQAVTASSSKAAPPLPPEEIELLLEQGKRFIADGDIVTARMIFERAAKAGDATAALALAAAYDPIVLAKLGVLGIDTDADKARIWYQKAQNLGSAEAGDRLDALARR